MEDIVSTIFSFMPLILIIGAGVILQRVKAAKEAQENKKRAAIKTASVRAEAARVDQDAAFNAHSLSVDDDRPISHQRARPVSSSLKSGLGSLATFSSPGITDSLASVNTGVQGRVKGGYKISGTLLTQQMNVPVPQAPSPPADAAPAAPAASARDASAPNPTVGQALSASLELGGRLGRLSPLKRAVVMSELLGPPVSLRQN